MTISVSNLVDLVVSIIIKETSPELIILFGSQATGTASNTADIDIGIEAKQMTAVQWQRILEQVEQIPTLRSIDIVNLDKVSKNFREIALKEGKVLYSHEKV